MRCCPVCGLPEDHWSGEIGWDPVAQDWMIGDALQQKLCAGCEADAQDDPENHCD